MNDDSPIIINQLELDEASNDSTLLELKKNPTDTNNDNDDNE